MLQTSLDFATGTTEACQQLITRLFKPEDIFAAYRAARKLHRTGDIVLVASAQDQAGFDSWARANYVRHIRNHFSSKFPPFFNGIASQSAQEIQQLPAESDAFWLVVTRDQDMPLMSVMYALPYEMTAAS